VDNPGPTSLEVEAPLPKFKGGEDMKDASWFEELVSVYGLSEEEAEAHIEAFYEEVIALVTSDLTDEESEVIAGMERGHA